MTDIPPILFPETMHRARMMQEQQRIMALFGEAPAQPNARPVIVNERWYPSMLEASWQTGIPEGTLKDRLGGRKVAMGRFTARYAEGQG